MDAGADLGDVAEDLAREPFDPDEGPLARLAVLRLGPDRAALVAVTHHLVIDGISLPSLARRMAEAVCGGLVGQPADRYLDVVRHVLAAEDVARHRDRERWAERLPEGVRLPHWDTAATGGPPPDVADGRRLVTLSPAETTRLAGAVAAHGTNVFRYLLAAIHRALPVTGGDLTPVCAAASVRPRDGGQDDVVGCFVNEVPMTAEAVGPAASISDLLRRFDDRWRADLRRRAHPLVDVVGRVARDRSGGALQLNSVTASYRRTPDRLRWTDGPLRLSADLYQRYPAAKNEVCVRAFHHADHLRYEVQWGRNLPGGLGEVFTERLAAALSDPPGSPSAAR